MGKVVHDLHWKNPSYEEIPFEAKAKADGKWLTVRKITKGVQKEGFDGKDCWRLNPDGSMHDSPMAMSKQAWLFNPQGALQFDKYFPGLVFKGKQEINNRKEELKDREVYVLESPILDKEYNALYFDVKTGLLIRIGYFWYLEDYREVD